MRTDFIDNENEAAAAYDWRRDGWLAACALAAALLVISAATPPAPGYAGYPCEMVATGAILRTW
jgi:hypothetical protein